MSEIAVVIPTYRRETRLRFALEALAAQTVDRARFEVVVVRTPAAEGPYATAPEGLDVRFETAPQAGPAAQRNHGWRATSAPLIAFIDDDCRASPGWLEALLAVARPGCVIQGRTAVDPDERHLLSGLARTVEVEPPSPWYESCNIAYPRELLELLGGFDEEFGFPWGEDTDLGLRAVEAGASVLSARDALVWHAVVARTLPAALGEARRRESLPRLIARHPDQRAALYRRWFANRAHAAVAVGIAAAVLARHRGPGTALAIGILPFLAHNLDYNRGRGLGSASGLARFGAAMPGRLALDLAEIAASLRGSARDGSLVI